MKKAIVGILNNPAVSLNSHSGGMNDVVARLFNADVLTERDDWDQYDELIIYHGINYNPRYFNVFGGMNDTVLFKANKLSQFKGNIYTLDGFQFNKFSIRRKIKLYDDFRMLERIDFPFRKNIVVGDSHSPSVWPNEDYTISLNVGKTLFKFLKEEKDLSAYDHCILYFGNIDIRFHLSTKENPEQSTKDLFNRYCEYASKYNSTITQLLPIEHESRIIPEQGRYKGEGFFGSIEQRKELREIANDIIKSSGIPNIEWPMEFLDQDGNLSFDVMEPKRSVHLKPTFYLRNYKKQEKQQLTLF